jgi:Ca-activated chloride channel family protein
MKAFNNGDNKKAAENFTRAEWKASALYRNGDYEAAAKTLENTNSSDGYYNKGNALARLGKLEEAIKAYDKALELNESNEDASYNRDQVKQALKKQKQQNEQNQEGEKQQDEQQDQDAEQQGEQQGEQQDSEQQGEQQDEQQDQDAEQQGEQQQNSPQSDKQSSEQSEDKATDNSDKDQQQMEQEQLKQRDAKAEAEKQKQEEQQYQQDQKENQDESQQQGDKQQYPDTTNQEVEHKDSEEKPIDVEVNPMEASITEDEKATEQWLKRIPDDPGGLLRRKFYYQYKKIPNQRNDNEPW